MSSKNQKKKKMVFAPNSVFYKSPTSIGLQIRELTPNEKSPKKWLPHQKTETLNIQKKCSLNVIHGSSDTNC